MNIDIDKQVQKSPELDKLNTTLVAVRNVVINFLIPLSCVVITLVLGVLYIYPKYMEIPSVRAKITAQETLSANLDLKLSNLKNIIDYKEVIIEDSTLVDDVLPSEAKVPQLLTQIDTMAKESGLEVTRLSYAYQDTSSTKAKETGAPDVSDQTQTYITVNLSVDGTYDQIKAFNSLLESSARFVQVDDFRYTLSNKTESTGELGVTINLSAPYLYVVSTAVTDEPVDLDIKSKLFNDFIAKLKQLRFYRIGIDQVIEIPEALETTPSEQPQS